MAKMNPLPTFTSYDYNLDKIKTVEESPIEEFLQHTSITVVTNVKRSKGKVSKVIWLVIGIFSCLAMSYQSYYVYSEYCQCKTKEDKTYQPQEFAPFPSITLCDAKPLNWTYMESINHELVQKFNSYPPEDMVNRIKTILLYLLQASDKEREELYSKMEPFLPNYSFQSLESLAIDQIRFRHPFLGQCVTINPGLGDKQSALDLLRICSVFAMNVHFPINLNGRIPGMHGFSMGYILIHPKGTPPIFSRSELIKIYPYNKFTIKVVQELVEIKSDRSCFHCVNYEDESRQQSIFYEKGKKEYIYTMQACVETMVQKKLLQEFNCIDPYAHLENIRKEEITNATRFCTGNELIDIKNACTFGCSEFYTDVTVSRWSKLFDSYLMKNFTEYKNYKLLPTSFAEEETPQEYDDTMDATIKIFQQKGYLLITKLPMYSCGDILGIVGGNVSLWLGISIFSLWEVMELVFMLVVKKIKNGIANLMTQIK